MHYKKEEKLRILLKKNGQKELAPKQITTTLLYLGSPLMDFTQQRDFFINTFENLSHRHVFLLL